VRYLSVCSGIEAFSVAVDGMGWTPAGFAEIEPFPCHVLAHRFDATPPRVLPAGKSRKPFRRMRDGGSVVNHGDFTAIDPTTIGHVGWLVGGTPCQSFSFAGLRGGLKDARGNLTLEFVRLAREMQDGNGLAGLLWENVPGVLSDKTNAFGCFLGALVGHDDALVSPFGRRWPDAGMVAGPRARLAWRVLDSQYLGVPQRRRRVYVVADTGGGQFDPATVLFEPEGMRRDTPPHRGNRQDVAGTISARTHGGGGLGTDFDLDGGIVAPTLNAAFGSKLGLDNQHIDSGAGMFVTHSLRAEGHDASEDGTGRGVPLVAFDAKGTQVQFTTDGKHPPLRSMSASGSHANAGGHAAIAFDLRGREGGAMPEGEHDTANIRASSGGSSRSYVASSVVRRLTPTECERLQGFPDGWTDVPYGTRNRTPDGPRYKALGNSFTVDTIRWIMRRVDASLQGKRMPVAQQ